MYLPVLEVFKTESLDVDVEVEVESLNVEVEFGSLKTVFLDVEKEDFCSVSILCLVER